MKKMGIIASAVLAALTLASCSDDIEMRYPPKFELPELPHLQGTALLERLRILLRAVDIRCGKRKHGYHARGVG